jgi:hypothetical protein
MADSKQITVNRLLQTAFPEVRTCPQPCLVHPVSLP